MFDHILPNILDNIFEVILHINLREDNFERVHATDKFIKITGGSLSQKELVECFLNLVEDEQRQEATDFIDFSTVPSRLKNKRSCFVDLNFKQVGWRQVSFYPGNRDEQGELVTTVMCFRDITREKDREQLLVEALNVARHANQAKSTFLSSMSHDIRTPMNAIIGYTALAATHLDSQDLIKDYLRKITISGNHLLSLINDVLDMSRIESGRTKIEMGEVSLPEVLHDLRSIIQSNVQAKQLDFLIDTQDVIHEKVMTDKLRLNQVLINIMGNAIKFTPAGGTVSLRLIENPSPMSEFAEYEFHIKDTGIGMSKEYQDHIFEPFSREQTATVSGIQGSGLGMAITKHIVDMMGGAIAVNSEVGKGTEFTVILFLQKVSQPIKNEPIPELAGSRALVADDDLNTCTSVTKMLAEIGMRPDWTLSGREAVLRARIAREQKDEYKVFIIDWLMPDMNGVEVVRRIRQSIGESTPIIIITAYDWSEIEKDAREAGVTHFCSKPIFLSELRDVLTRPIGHNVKEEEEIEKYDFSGKRLLLVEDNAINQEIAMALLEETNISVDAANDGTTAIKILEENPAGTYDIVLMDVQMPIMDGYEATRQIRNFDDPAKANIPIVAITANAFDEDRRLAIEAGMNDHLTKPIEANEMFKTINRFFEKTTNND